MAMPIMGGVESTRRIREHERSIGAGPCRIVALTAHASPEDRDECLGAGMDAFLCAEIQGHARPCCEDGVPRLSWCRLCAVRLAWQLFVSNDLPPRFCVSAPRLAGRSR